MIETANYYFFFIVIFQKHIMSHIFFPFFYIVSMLVKKTKFPVVPVLDSMILLLSLIIYIVNQFLNWLKEVTGSSSNVPKLNMESHLRIML